MNLANIPIVTLADVETAATVTSLGKAGTTRIAYLRVGTTVLISQPTEIAPDTKITLGAVQLTLNEPTSARGRSITVHGVHLRVTTSLGPGFDVTVGYAQAAVELPDLTATN